MFGGILLGIFIGWITLRLFKSIDDFSIEVIITLVAVMLGTVVPQNLHLSAPLAMVAAGLLVGNIRARDTAINETTELYVDKYWELMDCLLNAILFVLIGMEMLELSYEINYILASFLTIPIILLCRYVSLWDPIKLF